MKMMWQILLTPVAALMFSSVHAECAIPEVVTVPEGGSATEEEMVAGQKQVKQYMANGQHASLSGLYRCRKRSGR